MTGKPTALAGLMQNEHQPPDKHPWVAYDPLVAQ